MMIHVRAMAALGACAVVLGGTIWHFSRVEVTQSKAVASAEPLLPIAGYGANRLSTLQPALMREFPALGFDFSTRDFGTRLSAVPATSSARLTHSGLRHGGLSTLGISADSKSTEESSRTQTVSIGGTSAASNALTVAQANDDTATDDVTDDNAQPLLWLPPSPSATSVFAALATSYSQGSRPAATLTGFSASTSGGANVSIKAPAAIRAASTVATDTVPTVTANAADPTPISLPEPASLSLLGLGLLLFGVSQRRRKH